MALDVGLELKRGSLGGRLRSRVGAIVVAIWLLALPAAAESFSACWVTTEMDRYGFEQQITRCRLAGGDIVDYASDSSVPGRLYPHPGADLTGSCWYYSSTDGNWLFRQLFSDGDAILGYASGGFGGGVAVLSDRVPRCTSEPTPITNPSADAWSYVTEYIHPPPTPELNPTPGNGITGLETYVGVTVPDDHTARLTGDTGTLLDVFIEVSAVVVDWGDGHTTTYPADSTALSGYPDGIATHLYETKDYAGYNITVSYSWAARWRVVGSPWEALVVPNTSTSVIYPVAEIISVITQ